MVNRNKNLKVLFCKLKILIKLLKKKVFFVFWCHFRDFICFVSSRTRIFRTSSPPPFSHSLSDSPPQKIHRNQLGFQILLNFILRGWFFNFASLIICLTSNIVQKLIPFLMIQAKRFRIISRWAFLSKRIGRPFFFFFFWFLIRTSCHISWLWRFSELKFRAKSTPFPTIQPNLAVRNHTQLGF